MRPPAYQALVEKSRAACVAAVETYNRASALYREENFSILMINAWELLLKARIVKENGGKLSSLYTRERLTLKNGKPSKRTKVRLTRYGSPHTIGIVDACRRVESYSAGRLDTVAVANIMAMLDIRDHATHFIAANLVLRKTLAELSLASVKNYVIASQKWFNVSYADLNLAAIPISFALDQVNLDAVAKATPLEVAQFLAHIKREESQLNSSPSEYSFSIIVSFDILKKATDGAVPIKLAVPGETAQLTVSIEDDRLPPGMTWNFAQLVAALRRRYSNFVQNNAFYKMKAELENNRSFCHERRLVPGNKKSSRAVFYNPNIMFEFDKHYTKKQPNAQQPA